MCGVIGFVDKKKQLSVGERKSLMNKMLGEIIYRGRDSSGIYEKEGVAIGHNRLAILDKSKKANQPLSSKDNKLVISYNGEIFNHLEMRENRLEYETHSDTETFLYAYRRYGKRVFELIRGMFAVSFYELELNKITLSVDRFGIKPLYYLNTEDWFAWSSELKTFKYLKGVNFNLNTDSLFEYGIFRTLGDSETMLQGIYKLKPSEIVEYRIAENDLSHKRYEYKDESNKNQLEQLLKQSVSEHTLSDVPIGFQLSGGVDSSLISALVKNILKQKEIHSFSIGLKDPKWNEFQYSREVAGLLSTKHHEIVFDQEDFCRNYPIAMYHLDEPVVYPNTIPIMLLSKFASNYVKVLLSGEGADELFGGYNRYTKILSEYSDNNSLLYSNSFSTPIDVQAYFRIKKPQTKYREELVSDIDGKSVLQKLSAYDLSTFLPSLLLRQDKMGMASTIESRFPFLDSRLADFALDLPPDSEKNNGLDTKIILKAFARRYLPDHIVFRKKCGFGLPISEWLGDSDGLGRYLKLFTNPKIEREYLNYPRIQECIDEHLKLGKDNFEIIWILLSLELWTQIFIDGEKPNRIWPSLVD